MAIDEHLTEDPQSGATSARAAPPGDFGLPWLGHTADLILHGRAFIERRVRAYGPVFHTGFMGRDVAVIVDAEAQRYVLHHNAQFPAADGYAFSGSILGERSLLLSDGEAHTHLRGLVQPAFRRRHYDAYLARMEGVCATVFDAWGKRGKRTFYRDAQDLLFRLSCAITLGVEDNVEDNVENSVDYRRLLAQWTDMEGGVRALVRRRIWLTPWRRALRARDWIDAILLGLIRVRRGQLQDGAEPSSLRPVETDAPTDILTALLQAQAGDPTFTDALIAQQLRLITFAGYGTIAGARSSAPQLTMTAARRSSWGGCARRRSPTRSCRRWAASIRCRTCCREASRARGRSGATRCPWAGWSC
jgi:cytochrome P450